MQKQRIHHLLLLLALVFGSGAAAHPRAGPQANGVLVTHPLHLLQCKSFKQVGLVEVVSNTERQIHYNYFPDDAPSVFDRGQLMSMIANGITLREYSKYDKFGNACKVIEHNYAVDHGERYPENTEIGTVVLSRQYVSSGAGAGQLEFENTSLSASEKNESWKISYTYDGFGRRKTMDFTKGTLSQTLNYAYEGHFLKSITLPNGKILPFHIASLKYATPVFDGWPSVTASVNSLPNSLYASNEATSVPCYCAAPIDPPTAAKEAAFGLIKEFDGTSITYDSLGRISKCEGKIQAEIPRDSYGRPKGKVTLNGITMNFEADPKNPEILRINAPAGSLDPIRHLDLTYNFGMNETSSWDVSKGFGFRQGNQARSPAAFNLLNAPAGSDSDGIELVDAQGEVFSWDLSIPNGEYDLQALIGRNDRPKDAHDKAAVLLANDKPLFLGITDKLSTVRARVTVAEGKLTLQAGPGSGSLPLRQIRLTACAKRYAEVRFASPSVPDDPCIIGQGDEEFSAKTLVGWHDAQHKNWKIAVPQGFQGYVRAICRQEIGEKEIHKHQIKIGQRVLVAGNTDAKNPVLISSWMPLHLEHIEGHPNQTLSLDIAPGTRIDKLELVSSLLQMMPESSVANAKTPAPFPIFRSEILEPRVAPGAPANCVDAPARAIPMAYYTEKTSTMDGAIKEDKEGYLYNYDVFGRLVRYYTNYDDYIHHNYTFLYDPIGRCVGTIGKLPMSPHAQSHAYDGMDIIAEMNYTTGELQEYHVYDFNGQPLCSQLSYDNRWVIYKAGAANRDEFSTMAMCDIDTGAVLGTNALQIDVLDSNNPFSYTSSGESIPFGFAGRFRDISGLHFNRGLGPRPINLGLGSANNVPTYVAVGVGVFVIAGAILAPEVVIPLLLSQPVVWGGVAYSAYAIGKQVYDVHNGDQDRIHYGTMALDAVGLIPLAGVVAKSVRAGWMGAQGTRAGVANDAMAGLTDAELAAGRAKINSHISHKESLKFEQQDFAASYKIKIPEMNTYLKYRIHGDTMFVEMIDVTENLRRQGISNKLFTLALKRFPNTNRIEGVAEHVNKKFLKETGLESTPFVQALSKHGFKFTQERIYKGHYLIQEGYAPDDILMIGVR